MRILLLPLRSTRRLVAHTVESATNRHSSCLIQEGSQPLITGKVGVDHPPTFFVQGWEGWWWLCSGGHGEIAFVLERQAVGREVFSVRERVLTQCIQQNAPSLGHRLASFVRGQCNCRGRGVFGFLVYIVQVRPTIMSCFRQSSANL